MGRVLPALFLMAWCCCGGVWLSVCAAAAPVLPRVVYGFDREFPPFSFEEPGGKPVGFDVELAEAVLKGRVNLVFRPLQWSMVPLELSSGVIHVTNGMVRTQQRSKMFAFSDKATLALQIRLFTKVYNRFPNMDFLRGQRVSVEQGSYAHRLLENYRGFNIRAFQDKAAPIRALQMDDVAAYCAPVPAGYYYINKLGYSGITTLGTPLGIVEMRFAVNRGRGDVLKMVNDGLSEIMTNGEYNRIYRKWFVADLTAEQKSALQQAAQDASRAAYAPYSGRLEGAAVLTATGKIHSGCTMDNADAQLSVTAAASAMSRAVAEGDIEIRAVACIDQKGAVRKLGERELQVIHELGRGILVMGAAEDGRAEIRMVGELLPNPLVGKTPVLELE